MYKGREFHDFSIEKTQKNGNDFFTAFIKKEEIGKIITHYEKDRKRIHILKLDYQQKNKAVAERLLNEVEKSRSYLLITIVLEYYESMERELLKLHGFQYSKLSKGRVLGYKESERRNDECQNTPVKNLK